MNIKLLLNYFLEFIFEFFSGFFSGLFRSLNNNQLHDYTVLTNIKLPLNYFWEFILGVSRDLVIVLDYIQLQAEDDIELIIFLLTHQHKKSIKEKKLFKCKKRKNKKKNKKCNRDYNKYKKLIKEKKIFEYKGSKKRRIRIKKREKTKIKRGILEEM